MNSNDARDALDDLLARAIDSLPIDAFAIDPRDAQSMLDAIPADLHQFHAALRDAFRENIDADDDTHLI
jgi:hypothetical protein